MLTKVSDVAKKNELINRKLFRDLIILEAAETANERCS